MNRILRPKAFNLSKLFLLALPGFALAIAGEYLKAHEVLSDYKLKPIPLRNGNAAIILDHLAYDRSSKRLWVPASDTGDVDVIDCESDTVSHIGGFPSAELKVEGQKAQLGPTAVALGDGVVYVGNRGESALCVIDSKTLTRGECVPVSRASSKSDTGPHQVVLVADTREVWVTTGPGRSIDIFDASDARHPRFTMKIDLESETEGAAVDDERGRFYTNLAEKGLTIAIDLHSRKVMSKWETGSNDLQGLALDRQRGFLFVACADHIINLDIVHDGKLLDSIPTGAGLDDIDFSSERKLLYAAASVTGTLSIINVSDDGKLHLKALVPTTKGARGVAAGGDEAAYLIDPANGQIVKLTYEPHDKATNN
jgi:DNA-binding beta-propeller fold protein YncE